MNLAIGQPSYFTPSRFSGGLSGTKPCVPLHTLGSVAHAHGLQRLAATWLTTFAHDCAQPGFAIDTYLREPETSEAAGVLVTA